MDPDRLKFLKEMLKRREGDFSSLNADWSEMYNDWYRESPWEMVNKGQFGEPSGAEMLEDIMRPKANKLRRDHIKQMFEAEDALKTLEARTLSTFGKSGKIEDLLWHAQNSNRRNRGRPRHTVHSVRRLLDKAKGITSLIPKGAGKAFSILGPIPAALGLAFDQATASDELGAGEDEFLRQMQGDTGDLTEEEMMQYYNALLGHD